MPSITTWTRLEPRSRGDDLTPSLEARVHDPAWLLGRQWQIGEFVGEDAGTPIHVRLAAETHPIVAYRSGGQEGAVDPGAPLDCTIGAEVRGAASLAERAEAGVELLDLLAGAGCSAAGVAALIGHRTLPAAEADAIGSDGAPFLALAAGRLPDGDALAPALQAMTASGQVPAALALSANDARAVLQAARAWLDWRASLTYAAPASAWVGEQLEYRFALAAQPPGAGVAAYALSGPSWDGDRLDWYDLEVDRRVAPPVRPAASPAPLALPGVDPATGSVSVEGLPAPLTYPGMPASRWWQFEDARVNFAQIAAAPEDLARMLVVEFASVFSNDWYLWPLVLPIGAVHRITKLEVVNTFGDVVEIGPAAAAANGSSTADWQLFRPTEQRASGGPAAFDGLALLPTLASALQSDVFEDVRLLRDEAAELAWAVEATVRGQDGLPLDRHRVAAAAGDLPAEQQATHASDTGGLTYRFETDVPVYWFPLAPDPSGAPKFQRLVVRRVDSSGNAIDVLPKGDILSPKGYWLWQEEVPREGASVVRRYRMTRSGDGRLFVWGARLAGAGRGEGSSGLRYDQALPATEAAAQ